MVILAVDTATEQASLALLRDDTVTAELSWLANGNHSVHLAQALSRLLSLGGARIDDLSAIAVAKGPGSFNGLRVGVSAAKGLAMARHIPLAGFSTLDAIAVPFAVLGIDVMAVIRAGRGEIYTAIYSGKAGDWHAGEHRRMRLADAAVSYQDDVLLCGNGAQDVAHELAGMGRTARVAEGAWNVRRAGYLAELGKRYFDASGTDQLEELHPLYLRRSSAEEKREATGRE